LSNQALRFTSNSTSSLDPPGGRRSNNSVINLDTTTVASMADCIARMGGISSMRPVFSRAANRCSTSCVTAHACALAFIGQEEYLNGSTSALTEDH